MMGSDSKMPLNVDIWFGFHPAFLTGFEYKLLEKGGAFYGMFAPCHQLTIGFKSRNPKPYSSFWIVLGLA